MHATLPASALAKALSRIKGAISSRNIIPVRSHVLIEAPAWGLILTATDMELTITEKVQADVRAAADVRSVVAPFAQLHDIARKAPKGATIELAQRGDDLAVKAGALEVTLPLLPVKDFPPLTVGETPSRLPHRFTMPAADLHALFDRTRHAISTEQTRYYLMGVYLHVVDHKLTAVATDGHRLARVEHPEAMTATAAGFPPGIIVPQDTVDNLCKLLAKVDGPVDVALSAERFTVQCGGMFLLSKTIDGTFPEYQRVIPRYFDGLDKYGAAAVEHSIVRADRDILANAVRSIASSYSKDSDDWRTKPVRIETTAGADYAILSSADGKAAIRVPANLISGAVYVGAQSRYVLDALASMPAGPVELRFGDKGAQFTVQAPGDAGNALCVIMPIRI